MCGLAGYFTPSGFQCKDGAALVKKMTSTLSHRGPDDSGEWVDGIAGVALGHRRLSILDLSSAGHQPMTSASGRYILAFNGEIYNHLDLRKCIEQRKKISWRGFSDTETLLAGFEKWGFENAIKKTIGTFGLALWDRKKRILILARDRMGEKPLYYGWQNGTFIFGSELKALRKHSLFNDEINREIVVSYLQTGSISAPNSIYKDIYKVMPGSYIEISTNSNMKSIPDPIYYWSLADVARSGVNHTFNNHDELTDELESLVNKSVSLQTISDVPLGAYLSGGIDSSLIVALLQSNSMNKVKTFTIGYEEKKYDESKYAQLVADHLGTDHTTMFLTKKDIISTITNTHGVYDEPLSDSSASLEVSTLAKNDVKVALSGDGGDELFAGYDHYFKIENINRIIGNFPNKMRPLLSMFGSALSSKFITKASEPFMKMLNINSSIPLGLKIHKLASIFNIKNHNQLYTIIKTSGMIEESLINESYRGLNSNNNNQSIDNFENIINSMLFLDQREYLPSDILVKSDRNSMSVSLENRAPLLDHRVVEMAWKIPIKLKNHNGLSKWPLRKILYKHVPKKIIDRPKMGFGIPAEVWLRGPLKNWASDLLSAESLRQDNFFDIENVQYILNQHMSGKYNWQVLIWRLCAFQEWLRCR